MRSFKDKMQWQDAWLDGGGCVLLNALFAGCTPFKEKTMADALIKRMGFAINIWSKAMDDSNEVVKPKRNLVRQIDRHVYLNKEENDQLDYLCAFTGLNASVLLRRMIMMKKIPVVDTATAVNEMRRQGGLLKHIWLESGKQLEHEGIYAKGEKLLDIALRLEKELLK